MTESAAPVRWDEPNFQAVGSTVNTIGNNTVITPASGKRIGLQYICLSADGGNGADVVVTIKFTNAGAVKYKLSLKAGAIWARNIGARARWLAGGIDESLVVNLSDSQSVHCSFEYEEI